MSQRDIALIGNFSCSNRGDAAILRGLSDHLQASGIPVRVFSEQPDVAAYILDAPCEPSPLSRIRASELRSLFFSHLHNVPTPVRHLSGRIRAVENSLKDVAGIIFVGGSYFLDSYGQSKYYLPFLAQALGIPFALCGHSIGPFDNRKVAKLARRSLAHAQHIMLRDRTSLDFARQIDLPQSRITVEADTAWLTKPSSSEACKEIAKFGDGAGPVVAVTLRKLAPFDKLLGVTQEAFETSFVDCINDLIDRGIRVLGVSMCTGLGGYHMDDRLVVERVRRRLNYPERMLNVMNELSDVELGAVLGECDALVGTRMHSTILCMNAGTPAVALPYEHKSVGLFEKMGFADRVLDLKSLEPGKFWEKLSPLIEDADQQRRRTCEAAQAEADLAAEGVARCIASLGVVA